MASKFALEGVLSLNSVPFGRGIRNAARMSKKFGGSLARIGFKSFTAGAVVATAAATAFGIAAARSIAEYGTQLSKVKALTGATAAEFEALNKKARELGASTQFSAAEAAAGMAFLAQAGFKTNEIIAASADLLNLAAAGGLELADAMDIASNIMTPFSMSADEAGRTAMAKVAPVASQLGISLENTAAAIGILGNAGIQGSDAGTAMKNIMARLVKPTAEVTAGLDKLGLTFDDVNPATQSLSSILEKLRVAQLKVGDATTIAQSNVMIFGLRAQAAGGVLVKAAQQVREFTGELQQSNGAAAEMAATMVNNLAGDVKAAGSAFSEIQLAIGEGGLTGVLREATQWATNLMREFADSGKAAAVGKAIREAADAFKGAFANPELAMEALSQGLRVAGLMFLQVFTNGIVKAMELIGTYMSSAPSLFTQLMVSSAILWGLEMGLMALETGDKVRTAMVSAMALAATVLYVGIQQALNLLLKHPAVMAIDKLTGGNMGGVADSDPNAFFGSIMGSIDGMIPNQDAAISGAKDYIGREKQTNDELEREIAEGLISALEGGEIEEAKAAFAKTIEALAKTGSEGTDALDGLIVLSDQEKAKAARAAAKNAPKGGGPKSPAANSQAPPATKPPVATGPNPDDLVDTRGGGVMDKVLAAKKTGTAFNRKKGLSLGSLQGSGGLHPSSGLGKTKNISKGEGEKKRAKEKTATEKALTEQQVANQYLNTLVNITQSAWA